MTESNPSQAHCLKVGESKRLKTHSLVSDPYERKCTKNGSNRNYRIAG